MSNLGRLLIFVVLCGLARTMAFADTAPPAVDPSQYPPDIAAILRKGELVVAFCSSDDKPYFYVDEKGYFTGRDAEFARLIAKRLGVKVVFNRNSPTFDGVVDEVARHRADLGMGDLELTSRRAMKVSLSDPYKTAPACVLVNRLLLANAGWQTDILANMRAAGPSVTIGVIAHSANVDRATEQFPDATFVPYDSSEKLLQDVVDGKIFASDTGDSRAWMRDWLQAHPGAAFRALDIDTPLIEAASIAVAWQNGNLLNFINTYIWELRNNGILETWAN